MEEAPTYFYHGTTEPLHLISDAHLEPKACRHEPDKPQLPLVFFTPQFRIAEIYALKGDLTDKTCLKPFSVGQFDGFDLAIYSNKPSDIEGGWIYKISRDKLPPDFDEIKINGQPSGEYGTTNRINLNDAEVIKGCSLYAQMEE